MHIEGLIAPGPDDLDTLNKLADMMGESFLEENWTRALLDGLGDIATPERKLFLSREIMRLDFIRGAHIPACYATPDLAACAGGYRKSDLGDKLWADIEAETWAQIADSILTPEEAACFEQTLKKIEPVSDFGWEEVRSIGFDYIQLFALGVDKNARGTGAFRRLIEPIFAYADANELPIYLETYADHLIELYQHFGFQVVETLSASGVSITETCMERLPQ